MLPLKCMTRGSYGTAYAPKKRLCTKLDFWGLFITSFLTSAFFAPRLTALKIKNPSC